MSKILTLLFLSIGLSATAQDFTPAALLNFEFTLDNQVVPFERLTIVDPTVNPPDTLTVINVERNFFRALF